MTPLQHYLLEVRQEVSSLPGTQVELYREQLLTDTRANLRIRLRLADRSLLEIREALVVRQGALTWLSYRYHWQDAAGRLVLRYDDAPHHPEVDTFPQHQHVGEMVIASPRPYLPHLLAEIQRRLPPRFG
jgi:hypothetical protein